MKTIQLICNLCLKEIDNKKEKYVHVEDWNKDEIESEIWCHLACFNKSMNRELTEMEIQAKMMLRKTGELMNRIMPMQEVYEIK